MLCNRISQFQIEVNLHQDALRNLNHSLTLMPDQFLALCLRGITYNRMGKRQEALDDFATAACLDPSDLTRQEKMEKALDDYGRALAIDPDFLYSRIARGMLLIDLDRLEEATVEFDYILRRDPRNYRALIGVGKLQERHGNTRNALELFRRAATLGDPNGRYYFNLLATQHGLPHLEFDPLVLLFSAIVNSRQMSDLQQAVREMPFLLDAEADGGR